MNADWNLFDGYYVLAGVAMRTLGRTSDSIRLGLERGFDSGEMMDRIYQNRISGRYGVGWLADWYYLNQIGCQGLRGRKLYLKRALLATIQEQRQTHRRPVILDVAAGPATYLVETLAEIRAHDVTALCRDLDENGLRRGRELARQSNLENIRYERGDALDQAALLALAPRPTIIVASGFYEILTDDALIRRQMEINRQVLAPGGAFIFTTQINHPQLKLIARTLNNREGKPWIMQNRPLAQTERWALEAGFDSVASTIAPPGLYAITVAS